MQYGKSAQATFYDRKATEKFIPWLIVLRGICIRNWCEYYLSVFLGMAKKEK